MGEHDDDVAGLPAVTSPGGVVTFDYGQVDPVVVQEAREAAGRVRGHVGASVENAFRAGQELRAIKGRLPHGLWGAWLEAECSISERGARLFMSAAEWVETRLGGKTASVADLGVTALYELASPSAPSEVVEEFLRRIEEGERPTPAEVKAKVRAVRGSGKALRPARNAPHRIEPPPLIEGQAVEGDGEAARKAVEMLKQALGPDLAAFAGLIEEAGSRFRVQLAQAVEETRQPTQPVEVIPASIVHHAGEAAPETPHVVVLDRHEVDHVAAEPREAAVRLIGDGSSVRPLAALRGVSRQPAYTHLNQTPRSPKGNRAH